EEGFHLWRQATGVILFIREGHILTGDRRKALDDREASQRMDGYVFWLSLVSLHSAVSGSPF
ncbi:MAG TPA: hypothetical protein VGE39_11555, partial [Prosthecobacter sp.]